MVKWTGEKQVAQPEKEAEGDVEHQFRQKEQSEEKGRRENKIQQYEKINQILKSQEEKEIAGLQSTTYDAIEPINKKSANLKLYLYDKAEPYKEDHWKLWTYRAKPKNSTATITMNSRKRRNNEAKAADTKERSSSTKEGALIISKRSNKEDK